MARRGFLAEVEKVYPSLRNSEKRVADFVLRSSDKVPHLSITDLAKQSGTSEATVNRFCRSLGCSGYADMKIGVTRDLAVGRIKTVPESIDESDDLHTINEKLLYVLSDALRSTSEFVNPLEFSRALDAIYSARRVFFYGIGGSGAVARIAHHLFLKAGIVNFVYDDGYMQAVSAALLGRGDVAVGLSHSGKTRDIAEALRLARRGGATTIAISRDSDTPVLRHADIKLFTVSNEEPIYGDFVEAKVSQIFVIDLIYLGLILRNVPLATENLEKTAAAIRHRSYRTVRRGRSEVDSLGTDGDAGTP